MTKLPDFTKLNVAGPFWSAQVQALQLANPVDNWTLRTLFLDSIPQKVLGSESLLLPNTLLLLAWIQEAKITPNPNSYTWRRTDGEKPPIPPAVEIPWLQEQLKTGNLALLLVKPDTDPRQWQNNGQNVLPTLTCLAGDISLKPLKNPANASSDQALYSALQLNKPDEDPTLKERPSASRLPGYISLHSSGVSIFGEVKLPWQTDRPIKACFQLARTFPEIGFHLTVEENRLTPNERSQFIAAAKQLSRYINPGNPANGFVTTDAVPSWVALEIADLTKPLRLYWKRTKWEDPLTLNFDSGVVNLFLSDQSLYGKSAPKAIAQIATTALNFSAPNTDGSISIELKAGSGDASNELKYTFDASSKQETVGLSKSLSLAFSPVQTPEKLRKSWGLASPEWITNPAITIKVSKDFITTLNKGNLSEDDQKALIRALQESQFEISKPSSLSIITIENDKWWKLTEKKKSTDVEKYFFLKSVSIENLQVIEEDFVELEVSVAPNPIQPSWLWGSLPLEDGWAQLPIPNLTEQIYLDAELTPKTASFLNDSAAPEFWQGAVAWDNRGIEDKPEQKEEQPWRITLTSAKSLSGIWKLDKPKSASNENYQLKSIDLSLSNPHATLDGVLWLSTEASSSKDALPKLEPWFACLQSIHLESIKNSNLFPPVVVLELQEFEIKKSLQPGQADLGKWKFSYQIDEVYEQFIARNILKSQDFEKALIWRRHPSLPTIQTFPLTQNQSPPNFPSPNRQLTPFRLPVIEGNRPNNWKFGVESGHGAKTWSKYLGDSQPSREWSNDLPIAFLSLPGLILQKDGIGLPQDELLSLALQYRWDLPYTDEVNALSQLPQISEQSNESNFDNPEPLTPETFRAYWQYLAERAQLARADAVNSLENGQLALNHLVEPFDWPISSTEASLNQGLKDYPGKIVFDNTSPNGSTGINLSQDTALRGVSGQFELASNNQLNRLPDTAANTSQAFQITAGSMEAFRSKEKKFSSYRLSDAALMKLEIGNDLNETILTPLKRLKEELSGKILRQEELETKLVQVLGNFSESVKTTIFDAAELPAFMDQRGLLRQASQEYNTQQLIQTQVALQNSPTSLSEYQLTSTLKPLVLNISGSPELNCWFRDLPINTNGEFKRRTSQEYDVNDPTSLSRENNYLTGYEWCISPKSGRIGTKLNFSIFGLDFYPLTLEEVVIEPDSLVFQSVKMVGRLQLPLPEPDQIEQENFSNSICLVFSQISGVLSLTDLKVIDNVECFLFLSENEFSSSPYLTFNSLSPKQNLGIVSGVIINDPKLRFSLFDEIWKVDLKPITFPNPSAVNLSLQPYQTNAGVQLKNVTLMLDLDDSKKKYEHIVEIELSIELARQESNHIAFSTDPIKFTFKGRQKVKPSCKNAYLFKPKDNTASFSDFDGLKLSELSVISQENSLQFQWKTYEDNESQLLPGIYIKKQPKSESYIGYAVVSFEFSENIDKDQRIPKFRLTAGFIETLIYAQWREDAFLQASTLQEKSLDTAVELERAFGSSAGDLVVGYTNQLYPSPGGQEEGLWEESLLLNGVLEVKNLISWPESQKFNDATGILTLPAIRDASNTSLSHYRHTIRILFNQYQVPFEILTSGTGSLIFTLSEAKTWQFLGIVEHQFCKLSYESGTWKLSEEFRWTVTQEIRFLAPATFKQFLETQIKQESLDPVTGVSSLTKGYGYFNGEVNIALRNELNSPETIIVEASAPFWINQLDLDQSDITFTSLQFLPNGIQQAILSAPQNYQPSTLAEPKWLLIAMPFLGRLQDFQADDIPKQVVGLDNTLITLTPPSNNLQKDPILRLQSYLEADIVGETIPPLILWLTNWGDRKPVEIEISGLDVTTGHTWARLDTTSLEENWFRLQNPAPEAQSTNLSSVTLNFANSPARLSRDSALKNAFTSVRQFYPPKLKSLLPSTILNKTRVLWQQESIFFPQTISSISAQLPEGLQVLYTFEEGSGSTIQDVSGKTPPLNLTIKNQTNVEWLPQQGALRVKSPTTIYSSDPANTLINACKSSNEITIEAWIKPDRKNLELTAPVSQNIVSVSESPSSRNFTLAQGVPPKDGQGERDQWNIRLRRGSTARPADHNGLPAYMTNPRSIFIELTHVVFTRDKNGKTQLHINGEKKEPNLKREGPEGVDKIGNFDTWDGMKLALANELNPNSSYAWLGEYHQVAIYSRALTIEEVQQNFRNKPLKENLYVPAYGWAVTGLLLKNSELFKSKAYHTAATILPTPNQVALFEINPVYEEELNKGNLTQELLQEFISKSLLLVDTKSTLTKKGEVWLINIPNYPELILIRKVQGKGLAVYWNTLATRISPLNFVVSPYLGLNFRKARKLASSYNIGALFTELICLNPVSHKMLPVGSISLEFQNDESAKSARTWAKETHLRLCPSSPFALLRFRTLYASEENDPSDILITYHFELIEDLQFAEKLNQKTLPLRSSVITLRFREGQQRISPIPDDEVKAFELAPTQVTGVQPVVLDIGFNLPSTFPWGLSAIRYSVRQGQASAIGGFIRNNGNSNDQTLWWQSPQHLVQFSDNAGLPKNFRGKAIASLLPLVSALSLPTKKHLSNSKPFSPSTEPQLWQPVLPEKLSYWLVGTRSGVMIALRHQILRQHLKGSSDSPNSEILISSSVPIQHRSPRPVNLPPNHEDKPEFALQTWASYFEPDSNLFVYHSPVDEAFFAQYEKKDGADITTIIPNRRLRVILELPEQGVISSGWDGNIKFNFTSNGAELNSWNMTLKLVDGNQVFDYAKAVIAQPQVWQPNDKNPLDKVLAFVRDKSNGSRLTLQLQVTSNIEGDLTQILTFPLYTRSDTNFYLPLAPRFILFEDPEYNRRLASTPAKASRQFQVTENTQTVTRTVTLACDRKEYNVDSIISWRYDWDGIVDLTAEFKVNYIRKGISTSLKIDLSPTPVPPLVGKLSVLNLSELQKLNAIEFQASDILELELMRKVDKATIIVLRVGLVLQSITPVPEAGYALLRKLPTSNSSSVECVGFSWSPNPSRVELICANDLRSDLVRRRAVFQWQDSVRIGSSDSYALQKIALSGSTHIPIDFIQVEQVTTRLGRLF
jgi:hypothetical protein